MLHFFQSFIFVIALRKNHVKIEDSFHIKRTRRGNMKESKNGVLFSVGDRVLLMKIFSEDQKYKKSKLDSFYKAEYTKNIEPISQNLIKKEKDR